MQLQTLSRKRHHHKDKVQPHHPQHTYDGQTRQALRLQHALLQRRTARLRPHRGQRHVLRIKRDTVPSLSPMRWSSGRESSRVFHGRPAGPSAARNHLEPGHGEPGGVRCIHHAIDKVEPSEGETLQRRLLADVRRQEDGQAQREHRVYVHRQLDGRELEARQDREQAIDADELVKQHRECDQRSACLQAHDVEEGLQLKALVRLQRRHESS
ncbi:hypothetical protein H113_06449 [Trichophyton rubrum MR1459]|uniref:Uncharacterized protein n=1 Tax=Trichophyton rubrum (strain ATCC MYA-4607 / CBS 118892) TaxID=559305 RepID=A0A080WJ85_TRIRC|nr:uncharacterized protein TERG_11757 [Trichophyton rubrum CBS 118892]EZF92702.1 hypothetical protein H113_06449 [Trichophyton rubrum MR1459]KFL60687.1 hypothetical protein TERG_11757 [Trichophyton rubrum CBS 118892]